MNDHPSETIQTNRNLGEPTVYVVLIPFALGKQQRKRHELICLPDKAGTTKAALHFKQVRAASPEETARYHACQEAGIPAFLDVKTPFASGGGVPRADSPASLKSGAEPAVAIAQPPAAPQAEVAPVADEPLAENKESEAETRPATPPRE